MVSPHRFFRTGHPLPHSASISLSNAPQTHDARARPKSATPARPAAAPGFAAGYYSGNNYYMQPQFDYAMPSNGLRDYAVVGAGVNTSASASGSTPAMSLAVAPSQRRESAPAYYQTTPAPSPTPPQMFQAHKSMST